MGVHEYGACLEINISDGILKQHGLSDSHDQAKEQAWCA